MLQGHRLDQEGAAAAARLAADLGVIIANMKSLLQLMCGRALFAPDCKRLFQSSLHSMLQEKGTDTSVLLSILDIVKDWVENDFKPAGTGVAGALTNKDVVTFLQKMALVDRQNMSGSVLEEWENKFLNLVHRLSSDATK